MDQIEGPIEGPNSALNDAPTTVLTDTSNTHPVENSIEVTDSSQNDASTTALKDDCVVNSIDMGNAPEDGQDLGTNGALTGAPSNDISATQDNDPADNPSVPGNALRNCPTDNPIDGQHLGSNEESNNVPVVDPNDNELDINAKLIAESDARRRAFNAKGYLAKAFASFQQAEQIQTPLPPLPPLPSLSPAPLVMAGNPFRESSVGLEKWAGELAMGREDSPGYEEVFSWYRRLSPTLEDTVRFKIKIEEDSGQERSIGDNPVNERGHIETRQQSVDSDNELFVRLTDYVNNPNPPEDNPGRNNQTEESIRGPEYLKRGSAKRKRQNWLTAKEKNKCIRLGLETGLAKAKKSAAQGSRKRKANGPAGDQDASCPRDQGKIQKATRKRKQTLTDLVATMVASDRAKAKSDTELTKEATKNFEHLVRSDGSGGWKIKGLKTSLYYYQLLGSSFMREREKSVHPPFGGIIFDAMGFGEIIQALANIVDANLREPNTPVKTTLIVVPPRLVTYWKEQIRLHCDTSVVGHIVEHHAGTRVSGLNPDQEAQSLQQFDIVITTYEEIRVSYPKFRMPSCTLDEAEIEKEWNEEVRDSLGPLHRIKFRRILLDEARIIRNRMSQTSVAVRALHGHYKWVLNRTRPHDSIEECYPYFGFLGIPYTGKYEDFYNYYIKNENSQERLKNVFRVIYFLPSHSC